MTFDNLIFAGGGSRCFWQAGFCEGAKEQGRDLAAEAGMAGSTSAGSAIATSVMLGRAREALDIFKGLTAENHANIHWGNLAPFSGAPVLPHQGMYRRALALLLEAESVEHIRAINLHVLMSTYPRVLGGALGALLGFIIYALEKKLAGPIHPSWARRFGYGPLVGSSAEVSDKQAFIDLILAGSCVPPVLPGGRHSGRKVLDGGLVDNVPVLLAAGRPGRTLVLLSKRYGAIPAPTDKLTYVQPSEKIRIDKFDYANPEGLQEAFDLGLRDGERFGGLKT